MSEAKVGEATEARVAAVMGFATLGVLNTTQDLAGAVLAGLADVAADADLVAEETLALVATATARAAEVGLREAPALQQAVVPALMALPFTYRDYVVGGAMLAQQDARLAEAAAAVAGRLRRKQDFYSVHLPPNQFPGERALNDKMALWMGRISPPGLPETPTVRLERLQLVPLLLTHLRLVLAFGRQP